MGKVSEKDFADMSGRLRARATRLMRQLDAGAGYRSEIEQEITKRIGEAPPAAPGPKNKTRPTLRVRRVSRGSPDAAGTCASCGTSNDPDARFCKHCGHSMEARS